MNRRNLLALLLWPWLAGCATYATIENQPRASADASVSGYGMSQQLENGKRDDITLVLAFSGGGSRAAALAYGVLLELRDTRIGKRRLLDEVDAISGVSGGSFTAAYYGLRGEATFSEFEGVFLRRDLSGDLLRKIINPLRWFSSEGRSEAAATLFDAEIFHGATFADLQRAGGPLIVINATDLESGNRFAFLQEDFDLLCSDLQGFPVALAVAASAAVPVLLQPVVLENYGGCAPSALRSAPEDSPQLQQLVQGMRSYQDKEQRRYVHLVDGGLSGNLGLRAFEETIDLAGGLGPFLRRIGSEPKPNVMVVSVDASGNASAGIGQDRKPPSTLHAIDMASDVQLHRYNAATLEQTQESLQRWARQVSTPQRPVQPWLVTVALRDVPDPGERARLAKVPTSFDLQPEQVGALVQAGRALLRSNPEFREALGKLGGTPAQ